jgi:hypothetical protein
MGKKLSYIEHDSCSSISHGAFAFLYPYEICRGTILALIAITFFNDHFLKHSLPGIVTGKISDVTGTAFFVFLMAFLLRVCGELYIKNTASETRSERRGYLIGAALFTYLLFAAINLSPWFSDMVQGWMSTLTVWLGLGASRLTPDPTDLAAIPLSLALVVVLRLPAKAAQSARYATSARLRKLAGAAVLLFASFTSMATSSEPGITDIDIADLPTPIHLRATATTGSIDLAWEINPRRTQVWYKNSYRYPTTGPVAFALFLAEGDFSDTECNSTVDISLGGIYNSDGCYEVLTQFDGYRDDEGMNYSLDPQMLIALPEKIDHYNFNARLKEGALIPLLFQYDYEGRRISDWEYDRVQLKEGADYTVFVATLFSRINYKGVLEYRYSNSSSLVVVTMPNRGKLSLKAGDCLDVEKLLDEGYSNVSTECTERADLRLSLTEAPYLTLALFPRNYAGIIDAGEFATFEDVGKPPDEGYTEAGEAVQMNHAYYLQAVSGNRATIYIDNLTGFSDYESGGEVVCQQCVAGNDAVVEITMTIEESAE